MFNYALIIDGVKKGEQSSNVKINDPSLILMLDGEMPEDNSTYDGDKFTPPVKTSPILVNVTLDKNSAKLVNGVVTVNYTIEFSEPIVSPVNVDVPISVTDRNGLHVDNIGLSVTANTPTTEFTGSFSIEKRGDFTVTDEAINFHESTNMNIIARKLKLVKQPWLRIYQ